MTMQNRLARISDQQDVIAKATEATHLKYPMLEINFDVSKHEHDGITDYYFAILEHYALEHFKAEQRKLPGRIKATIKVELCVDKLDTDLVSAFLQIEDQLKETMFTEGRIISVDVAK
jgi:hypothetical protein